MLPLAMTITAPVECTQAVPSTFAMDPPWGHGPNQNAMAFVAARLRTSPALAFNSAGHEDGSDEKESPLQIERRVRQAGRRRVDDAT